MIEGNIEEMLRAEGVYISTTVGISMYPLLRSRRDNVIIRPLRRGLKRLDVPLYKRGDTYILHRIIGFRGDDLIIRGDNCYNKEIVPRSEVIGIATEFYRGERYFTEDAPWYKLYSCGVVFLHPVLCVFKRIKWLFGAVWRKIFSRPQK